MDSRLASALCLLLLTCAPPASAAERLSVYTVNAPGQEALAELDGLLERHPARWMLWEAPPSDAAVKLLEARGVGSLVFSPAANLGPQQDFLAVMRRNLANLRGIVP